jgi:hypothetical protein
LHPADADAVSDFAGGDAGADFDYFADRLVAQHAGKREREQTVGEMYIGVAQAAGVDLHDYLIGACFGGFPLFYFPLAVDRGDDCCFHEEDSRGIS